MPVAPEPTASDATTIGPQRFRIENMDCASEESEIRRALEGMAGDSQPAIQPGDRELAIAADDHALPEALEAIRKAGFKPEPLGAKNVQRFRIANMDCASEESEIRRALDGMAGIRSLQFNLGERELAIAADDPVSSRRWTQSARQASSRNLLATQARRLLRLPRQRASGRHGAVAGRPWVGCGGRGFHSPSRQRTCQGAGNGASRGGHRAVGFLGLRQGLAALRQGRLNINALMTVAVTGAFLIGQWPEAAMVMAPYVAEAIEARAVDRARGAIKSLLALAPDKLKCVKTMAIGCAWESRKSLWA